MALRIFISLIFLSLTVHSLWGQSGNLREGKKQYEQMDYAEAIVFLEAATDKNPRAIRRLIDSYLHIGDLKRASHWLTQIYRNPKRTDEDIWTYAQVLMQQGKYEAARQILEEFFQAYPQDSRARAYRNAGEFEVIFEEYKYRYKVKRAAFNLPSEQDFAPVLFENNLLFCSTRKPESPVVKAWGNNTGFIQVYSVSLKHPKLKVSSFNKSFEGKFHAGPVAFNRQKNVCLITKSNPANKEQATINLGIFISTKTEKGWSSPIPFPYNDPSYSLGHACFGPGDTIMYFTSNLPGGKGGTDIWYSQWVDSIWTAPLPLNSVNTEGNEKFPSFVTKGVLLFASDGHVGLGGLDLFAAKLKDGKYKKIRNLGVPVNSPLDDFAMTTDSAMRTGFFTSNRETPDFLPPKKPFQDTLVPLRYDNIYEVEFKIPFDFGRTLYGAVNGENGKGVEGVEVECIAVDSGRILKGITNLNGQFEIALPGIGRYRLKASKQSYFDEFTTLEVDSAREDYYTLLELKRDPNISIRLLITDSDFGDPLAGVSITLEDLLEGQTKKLVTDPTGTYQEMLPEKQLNDKIKYRITLEKKDHLTKIIDFEKTLDHFGTYEIHKAKTEHRHFDLSMRRKTVNDDLALQLGILPYFFGPDKTQVIPHNKELLFEIGRTMVINPGLEIKIVNHTDCSPVPGVADSRSANLNLSTVRAQAIQDFILSEFPELIDRISFEGKGDQQSKSECSCYRPGGTDCKEVDFQIDRRTEFVITATE